MVFFSKALKGDKSRLTVVLRCHLVIENAIESALEKKLADPDAFLDRNRPFEIKLSLLKALYGTAIHDSIYRSCKKIGVVRNKLAHAIDAPNIDTERLNFLSIDLPSMPGKPPNHWEGVEAELQDEYLIYKSVATVRDLMKVAYRKEIEEYKEADKKWMTDWIDNAQ